MAVKTFTNEQLTASDTNTFLANGGLVYITSVTSGTGVTSVTVSNCFTSTYDAYKIVASGGSTSVGSQTVAFNLNGAPAGWYGNLLYANFTSGAVTNFSWYNATGISHAGSLAWNRLNFFADIRNPNLASSTFFSSDFVDEANSGRVQVFLANTNQYTGFTITPAAGTMTSVTITVYGYRKA